MRRPRRSSPFESFNRFTTAVAFLVFTAFWVGLLGYYLVTAVIAGELGIATFLLVPATWFGLGSWSFLTYAFTGYHPRWSARLYNATWGWIAKPLPVRPRRT